MGKIIFNLNFVYTVKGQLTWGVNTLEFCFIGTTSMKSWFFWHLWSNFPSNNRNFR